MEENIFYENGKLFKICTFYLNGNKIVQKYIYENNLYLPYNENSAHYIEKYNKSVNNTQK
jgi:hypothetical protein